MTTTPHILADVTLALLAGGAGSRMGRPKGTLTIRGRPILEYLLDQFDWPGPTLLVTAPGRERPPGSNLFTREAIDPVSDQGPLRGVLTALESIDTPTVVIATVDMPEVRREHLEWLLGKLGTSDRLSVMCTRADGRIEPFPAAFRHEAVAVVASEFAAGRASVYALASLPGFIAAPHPDDWPERTWSNLNRPQDLQAWLANRG